MLGKVVMVLAMLTVCFSVAFGDDGGGGQELYMPDGQIKSMPVRIYVKHNVTRDMSPILTLIHAGSEDTIGAPQVVAQNQVWSRVVGGNSVTDTGTLFIYDLSDYHIARFKPMTRVIPKIAWTEGTGEEAVPGWAVSENDVYLGNLFGAAVLTIFLTGLFVLVVAIWSKSRADSTEKTLLTELLRGVTGKYSLSQFQICAWTIAIGGMVAMFGFIKLQVPTIPESLVALMGMSFATSGISYAWSQGKPLPEPRCAPALSDLIMNIEVVTADGTAASGTSPNSQFPHKAAVTPDSKKAARARVRTDVRATVSVPRTQMLFWTIILLVLFVSKSVLSGQLWDIPWPMVALMGISQTGYLAPKYQDNKNSSSGKPTD